MKSITYALLAVILMWAINSQAQKNEELVENNKKLFDQTDPEAKKIFTKLKNKYDEYGAISVKYTLTIENGDNKEVQNGLRRRSSRQRFR